jgi:hypothetical protein
MPSVEGVDNDVPQKGYGVRGRSNSSVGVEGRSDSSSGVFGFSNGSPGVFGRSNSGYGVGGVSNSGYGMYGESANNIAVYGTSINNTGVHGRSVYFTGVYGEGIAYTGVHGRSVYFTGVYGESIGYTGVHGSSVNSYGVHGCSARSYGVYAESTLDVGLYATSARNRAAYLEGNVEITGNLTKGGGSFKIDHPLDPANKYLHHSFVESPDMKNVYDGIVVLDRKGKAEIELPDWFGALNKDFRYQLTAIGAPGPNLYIAEEISDTTSNYTSSSNNNNSRFKIAGGTSGMKVSWQVTGIRKDPWANANRIEVEEEKPDKERGYYLHPDLYGQPEENGISHLVFPKTKEKKWQELLINENKYSNL